MQVLRFKNECQNAHTVRNVLIDSCRIDVTGLVMREDDAYVMLKNSKITEVFLPTGRKIFKRGTSVVGARPAPRFFFSSFLSYIPYRVNMVLDKLNIHSLHT